MLLLTADELRRLYEIVRDHHVAFAIRTVGADASGVTEEELSRLVALGYLTPDQARALALADPFGDAVSLAILRVHLEQLAVKDRRDPDAARDKVNGLSYDELRARLARDPVPMTPREAAAAAYARENAAIHCRGIGDAVARDVTRIVVATDRAAERLGMDEATAIVENAVTERRTWQQLKSDLGHASQDWAYDWDRVARTELQNAANAGDAARAEEFYGDEALVARVPNPSACEDCRRLFLDDEGRPRIWRLDELRANGNNVGRKRAAWVPTVDAIHPHCGCRLRSVPPGWRFTSEEDGWSLRPGQREPRRSAGGGEPGAAGSLPGFEARTSAPP